MKSRIVRAIAVALLVGTLLLAGTAPLAPPGTLSIPTGIGGQ
jgi:hypothetical protein